MSSGNLEHLITTHMVTYKRTFTSLSHADLRSHISTMNFPALKVPAMSRNLEASTQIKIVNNPLVR